jgi:serine/threonine-protein kinase HipA
MKQLIQTYFQQEEAGIFDMDESDRKGRFEWLPTFRDNHVKLVESSLVSSGESDTRMRCSNFDAHTDLPPIFRDYLPGGFARRLLREALANTNQTVEGLSTLAWLSLTGDRGMCAFRFEPAGYPELNQTEPVDLDKLVRSASMIYSGRGSELSERRLRELLRCGLFVRGNSPKILAAINDFTGEVLSGQGSIPPGYEAWIVKLDGVAENAAERLKSEFDYYRKALECGIQVSPCRMMQDGQWKHLLIKRFDRSSGERICVVGCPVGIDSWEKVFERMRTMRLSYPEIEEMYKRMVFCILTGNAGYDARKVCFTYHPSTNWSLAPAFNLKPTGTGKESEWSLFDKRGGWTPDELIRFGKMLNIRTCKKTVERFSAILL